MKHIFLTTSISLLVINLTRMKEPAGLFCCSSVGRGLLLAVPGGGGGQAVQDAPHVPRAALRLLQQHPALTSAQRQVKQVEP